MPENPFELGDRVQGRFSKRVGTVVSRDNNKGVSRIRWDNNPDQTQAIIARDLLLINDSPDHAQPPAPRETWRIEGSTATRIRTEEWTLQNVHREEDCQAPCTLHSPTDHHMRDWPLKWDPSQPAFFRECPHAELHLDPDAPARTWAVFVDCSYNGCDGCCVPTDETAERLASRIALRLDGSWVDFDTIRPYNAAVGPDSNTEVTVFVPSSSEDSVSDTTEYRITIERVKGD